MADTTRTQQLVELALHNVGSDFSKLHPKIRKHVLELAAELIQKHNLEKLSDEAAADELDNHLLDFLESEEVEQIIISND